MIEKYSIHFESSLLQLYLVYLLQNIFFFTDGK